MHYNNWAMFLTQFMACEGYFKGCQLILMHGTPPRFTEQWQDEYMALFLNDRRSDWIARFELKDSYPYRVDNRSGILTDPKWGTSAQDIYYVDFDRPEDTMLINLTPGVRYEQNDAWLASGQPKPTWFVVANHGYGPSETSHDGSRIRMVGKLGLIPEGLGRTELVRMIRQPAPGEFPVAEDILPFTVPVGG